jgi:hypothetical protein
MTSLVSRSSYEPLPESEIVTESEPDKLSQILTDSRQTTCDQRLAIKTALRFKVLWSKIRKEFNMSNRQIQHANCYRLTPQKKKCSKKPRLFTPPKKALKAWLLESPSWRHVPWKQIPLRAPEFSDFGEQAISIAMKALGYRRQVAKRKGFLTDLDVMRKRLEFVQEAINWTRERLYLQIFSDEV